jgi:hypothetical protein
MMTPADLKAARLRLGSCAAIPVVQLVIRDSIRFPQIPDLASVMIVIKTAVNPPRRTGQ